MTITFEKLRHIKDSLPNGSMKRIANELNLNIETVRNYFGGADYLKGESVGNHYEKGPYGGIVLIKDTTIYDLAQKILKENEKLN